MQARRAEGSLRPALPSDRSACSVPPLPSTPGSSRVFGAVLSFAAAMGIARNQTRSHCRTFHCPLHRLVKMVNSASAAASFIPPGRERGVALDAVGQRDSRRCERARVACSPTALRTHCAAREHQHPTCLPSEQRASRRRARRLAIDRVTGCRAVGCACHVLAFRSARVDRCPETGRVNAPTVAFPPPLTVRRCSTKGPFLAPEEPDSVAIHSSSHAEYG